MRFLASTVFDFLEKREGCLIDRYELNHAAFGALRRSLRQIVFALHESDDPQAREISERLRLLLSEWLTVPVPFGTSLLRAMTDTLGEADRLQARWGRDIRRFYDIAYRAAEDLAPLDNPMRDQLSAIIREHRSNGVAFKILCHRRAQAHFESLLDSVVEPEIGTGSFIHSVRDYRESELFDALIKVGPLRTRGWGSAPDALITAPRFATLVQVVWAGCDDEPNFGYDPVSSRHGEASHSHNVQWATRRRQIGEDPGSSAYPPTDLDELQAFRELTQPQDRRAATLVMVDGDSGLLYPSHSVVLSFDADPGAKEPISRRIPGDTLTEGMYLIVPLIDEVDLGGVRAEHGHHSRIWKDRLDKEWRADPARLMSRLRSAGLDLVHLEAAIRHWCKPPSTVIHAPQQIRHFEILIEVLGLVNERQVARGGRGELPWWKVAWFEIRRSRGEAIQAGVYEKEIVDDQLLDILLRLVDQIRDGARSGAGFHLPIPTWSDVHGQFLFHKISGIEHGFLVPESELKVVRELSTIDQWRS